MMWMMLQQDEPDDYVICSGETHYVEELVRIAFERAGLNWKDYVVIDERFVRPAEVDLLIGDAAKAREKLGWEPQVSFEEMIGMMIDNDLKMVQEEIDAGLRAAKG